MEREDGVTKPKRIPLGIMTLDQARAALEKVRTENRQRKLALPGRGTSPAHSLRESFKMVRAKAKLAGVGFHELRHFFASQCVMAGIDFMTVAHWLGHSEGGVLVGKVY